MTETKLMVRKDQFKKSKSRTEYLLKSLTRQAQKILKKEWIRVKNFSEL